MASIICIATNQTQYLHGHHTFGRQADKVDTFIDGPAVSKIHAEIYWDEKMWLLKDVSRNGVWVDGERIAHLKPVALKAGQKISFAKPGDVCLEMVDVAPPQPVLLHGEDPNLNKPIEQHTILPDDQAPEVFIFRKENTGQWCMQMASDASEVILSNGQTLPLAAHTWTVFVPMENELTRGIDETRYNDIKNYEFEFTVSLDEESNALVIHGGGESYDLGIKTYFYLMVYLARQRMQDSKRGLAQDEQGWVDLQVASRELDLEESNINIQIFRMRKMLAKKLAGVMGLDKVVERHRRGLIRLGVSVDHFKVIKNGEVES